MTIEDEGTWGFLILASIKEKETQITGEENEWAREEEDKTGPTWSTWVGPREGE